MSISKVVTLFCFITLTSLPFYVVRFYGLFFPLTFLELCILITFVTWLFMKFSLKESLLPVFKFRFFWIGIFILIVSLIEVGFSMDQHAGYGVWKAYFLEPFLFYLVLRDMWGRGVDGEAVVKFLSVSGLFLSVLSFLQFFTGVNQFAPHEVAQGRVTGVYNTGNALGLFLGPLIALQTARFVHFMGENKRKTALISLFYVSLWLVTIFLSKSRGSLVALSVLFAVYLIIFYFRLSSVRRVFGGVLLFLGVLLVIAAYSLYAFYGPLLASVGGYQGDDTLLARLHLWSSTGKMLVERPLQGAGLGGFGVLYETSFRSPFIRESVLYPHNFILTLWAEIGLLGLLGFIGVFTLLGSIIFKIKSQSYSFWFLGWAVVGAFLYTLLHGMVDVPYFKNDLSVLWWILVVMVESLTIKKA